MSPFATNDPARRDTVSGRVELTLTPLELSRISDLIAELSPSPQELALCQSLAWRIVRMTLGSLSEAVEPVGLSAETVRRWAVGILCDAYLAVPMRMPPLTPPPDETFRFTYPPLPLPNPPNLPILLHTEPRMPEPETETEPFPPEGVVFRRVRYLPCEGVELQHTAVGYRITRGPGWPGWLWGIETLDELPACVDGLSASARHGWFTAHPEPSQEARDFADYVSGLLEDDTHPSDPDSPLAAVSCGLVTDESPEDDETEFADVAHFGVTTRSGRRYRLTLAEDVD